MVIRSPHPVQSLFNGIAHRYDWLNHFLSAGRDRAWRQRAAQGLKRQDNPAVLDLCGGTGDFLLAFKANQPGIDTPHSVIADFSLQMLAKAPTKLNAVFAGHPPASIGADALTLPFRDESFDVVLCGYGMRNLDNLDTGLREVKRVLKPGGQLCVLEFFRPDSLFTKFFYHGAAPLAIPILGGLMSRKDAYTYLVRSVQGFLTVSQFSERLKTQGFTQLKEVPCDFGISHIVYAQKGLS